MQSGKQRRFLNAGISFVKNAPGNKHVGTKHNLPEKGYGKVRVFYCHRKTGRAGGVCEGISQTVSERQSVQPVVWGRGCLESSNASCRTTSIDILAPRPRRSYTAFVPYPAFCIFCVVKYAPHATVIAVDRFTRCTFMGISSRRPGVNNLQFRSIGRFWGILWRDPA